MRPLKLFFTFALIAFSGCVSIKSTIYPGNKFAPISPSQVQVLETLPNDPATYTVIGEVEVEETTGEYDPIFRARLKKKVANLGAHAIVLTREVAGYVSMTTPAKSSTTTSYSGTVSGVNVPGQIPIVSGQSNSQTTYTPASTTQIPSYSGHGTLLRYNDVEYIPKPS